MRSAPAAHQVHLWRASLDAPTQQAAQFAATLSEAEMRRVARLRRPVDRARYAVARGWLRQLIATYLDVDPSSLVFESGAHGKPRLEHPRTGWLRFNMSHSAAVMTIAVACDRAVGVDVEQLRDDVDVDGVARRYFTRGQRGELAVLDPADRARAFFTLWTRHEAYLKATGTGLVGAGNATAPPGWTLAGFDAGTGYAAAVAVEGDAIDVPSVAMELST